jgi:hypothetical protein
MMPIEIGMVYSSKAVGTPPQAHLDRRTPFSGLWLLRMPWVFNPSGSPANSFAEMVRNVELQREGVYIPCLRRAPQMPERKKLSN